MEKRLGKDSDTQTEMGKPSHGHHHHGGGAGAGDRCVVPKPEAAAAFFYPRKQKRMIGVGGARKKLTGAFPALQVAHTHTTPERRMSKKTKLGLSSTAFAKKQETDAELRRQTKRCWGFDRRRRRRKRRRRNTERNFSWKIRMMHLDCTVHIL